MMHFYSLLTVVTAAIALHIRFTAALATPHAASSPNGSVLTLPPAPASDESVDQYITQLFGSVDNSSLNANISEKRDVTTEEGTYREYKGFHELSWTNDTIKTSYNITLDLSNTCAGLKFNSSIGVYTFTNGTTANDTNLQNIIQDLWTLSPTRENPQRRWANHTATLAQLALDEANEVLYNGPLSLICRNKTTAQTNAVTTTDNSMILHDEFRRLQASDWSYWTVAIGTAMLGAGLGAAIGATANHLYTGNISDMNVVQTAVVVGATIILGSIMNRQHEIGRIDRGAVAVQNGAARGREMIAARGRQVIAQNILTGYLRSVIVEVKKRKAEQALRMSSLTEQNVNSNNRPLSQQEVTAPLPSELDTGKSVFSQTGADASGFSDLGSFTFDDPRNPGDQTPGGSAAGGGTPRDRSSGHWICLSDDDAAAVVESLEYMSDDEIRLRTMQYMETIQEAQLSDKLGDMENGEAGRSNPSCDWESFEIDSSGRSRKASEDVPESSAQGAGRKSSTNP